MPPYSSTLGLTMPQPRISSQSAPAPIFNSPPAREQPISTSAEGSVKGKELAHMRRLVDHQPLDLMEHRRVRRVVIRAEGSARHDDADRRLLRQHGADLDRRGVGTQQPAMTFRRFGEIERVV